MPIKEWRTPKSKVVKLLEEINDDRYKLDKMDDEWCIVVDLQNGYEVDVEFFREGARDYDVAVTLLKRDYDDPELFHTVRNYEYELEMTAEDIVDACERLREYSVQLISQEGDEHERQR